MATSRLVSRENNIAHIIVELDAEEVGQVYKQIYKEYAKTLKVPGFRKGHIPPAVIKNRIGEEQISAIALDQLKDVAATSALSELRLTPRQGRAKWIEEPEPAESAPLKLEFSLPVLPQVKLPDYHSYKFPLPVLDITDSMKDRFKERLAERYTQFPESPGPVTADGAAKIDLHSTYKDTGEGSPLHVHGMLYILGREGNLPGWDELLVGHSAGDKVEFDYSMPDNFADPRVAGRELHIEITIESVASVLPVVIDEAFVKNHLRLDTMEQFDDFVQGSLSHERDLQQQQMKIDLAVQKIIDELDAEITEDMVEAELDGLVKENDRTLRQYESSLDAYLQDKNQSLKEYRDSLRPAAVNRIKSFLAVKTISEEQNLQVTGEEFQRYVLSLMRSEDLSQDDIEALLKRQEFVNDVHYQIIRHKAFEHVAASAKYNEEQLADDSAERKAGGEVAEDSPTKPTE